MFFICHLLFNPSKMSFADVNGRKQKKPEHNFS